MAYSYSYCTQQNVESILSEEGVLNRLDDSRTGVVNAQWMTDCLQRATAEINLHLSRRYSTTTLRASEWVRWCAATLTASFVMGRRGLGSSPVIADEALRFRGLLEQIQKARLYLPDDAPLRGEHCPAMVNVTMDMRYPQDKIRVQPNVSVAQPAQDVKEPIQRYGTFPEVI